MVMIEDLSGTNELDSKAMARIKGGVVPQAAVAVGIGLVVGYVAIRKTLDPSWPGTPGP